MPSFITLRAGWLNGAQILRSIRTGIDPFVYSQLIFYTASYSPTFAASRVCQTNARQRSWSVCSTSSSPGKKITIRTPKSHWIFNLSLQSANWISLLYPWNKNSEREEFPFPRRKGIMVSFSLPLIYFGIALRPSLYSSVDLGTYGTYSTREHMAYFIPTFSPALSN